MRFEGSILEKVVFVYFVGLFRFTSGISKWWSQVMEGTRGFRGGL